MPQAERIHSTCPVAALAIELAGIVIRQTELEKEELAGCKQARHKIEFLDRRLRMVEHRAAAEEANSPRGAMVQLMLVHREAELLEGLSENPLASDIGERIEGLLYSIAGFMADEFGLAEDELGDHYMPQRINPLTGARAALAGRA